MNHILRRLHHLKKALQVEASYWQQTMLRQHHNYKKWHKFITFKQNVDKLYNFEIDLRDFIYESNLEDYFESINSQLQSTERLQSTIALLLQLHFAAVAHRNNEILRLLAIFSSIFMPLTLISGIFGMNFHNMPLLADPHAYHGTLASMFLIGISLLLAFKYKRWL